jgi:peptidoglycan hydrolase-like protein with peptidoglycan-binding domain
MALDRELAFRLPMMTGDDVRRVQQALVRAGVLTASGADGIFGPGTREAVVAFQRQMAARNPAITVDGIVGRDTWSALFPDSAAAQPAPGVSAPAALGRANGGSWDSVLAPAHAAQPQADAPWRAMLRPYAERLATPHGPPVGGGNRRWHLTSEGIEIEGMGVVRTGGQPTTAGRVWTQFRAALEKNAAAYGVPVELIVACICTESRGNPNACREEPGFTSDAETPHRVSPGLMQTLISTAREATREPTLDRAALLDPETSIRAGTAYLKQQAMRQNGTNFDPPLVGIAYNAGSLRRTNDNPWGLIQTARPPEYHADVFVAFFNDCFAVFADLPPAERPQPHAPSFWMLLNG